MKKINSLSDLLMEELADLLSAESQLVEALPRMADACRSSALKSALEDTLEITLEHVNRLQGIFSNIGQNAPPLTCKAMKGFINEIEEVLNKTERGPASDSAMVGVIQRVQRYKISRYKKTRVHAADLGHTKMVEIFTATLNEEREDHFRLNELAQFMINVHATDSKGGGFYITEGRFGRRGIKKKKKNADVSRFISEGNPNIQDQ